MSAFRSPILLLAALAASLTLGCHAQSPAASAQPGKPVSPELAHRIEVLLRQKANLPPGSAMNIGNLQPADIPGWSKISITFTNEGSTSHPIEFLVSADGKSLAQFNKFDISGNPRELVSPVGRPPRGGPATAPVLIVGFDDLECPYCARLHESIFPAILNRYGNSVRIVYKDFPLDQHPWAMHAAVDVNCLGDQSTPGYWNLVDYIHAHASDFGKPAETPAAKEKADKAPAKPADGAKATSEAAAQKQEERTLERADTQLDDLVREQAKFQKADVAKLNACMAKQDTKAIEASRKLGEGLGVDSTPSLFINGDKIDGAVPLEFIFARIDDAMRAAGAVPPPPYVAPQPPAAPASQAKSPTTTPGAN